MVRSFSAALALVLALLGGLTPGVASAVPRTLLPWGPPTPLVHGKSDFPSEFGDTLLHAGDDGSMLVTLRTGRGFATAVRPSRGRFGAPHVLRTGPGKATDELQPMVVADDYRDLTFARLDVGNPATMRPVMAKGAVYVTSGWDGRAAIVVARVACTKRLYRTDAWVLTATQTRRARVWPCQRLRQPPMALDGAGHLVLAGDWRRDLFVARASCRLATWIRRPRAACRPPRA